MTEKRPDVVVACHVVQAVMPLPIAWQLTLG